MKSNNNKKLVKLDNRVKQVGGTLIIKEAQVEDSGKYLCMVNNSVGGESVETVLTVTGKTKVTYYSNFSMTFLKSLNSSKTFILYLSNALFQLPFLRK